MVLRKKFGPKKDEMTCEWRRLPNEEFYDLYSSPNIIRAIILSKMRWAEHVARLGDRRGAYRVLVRIPDEKRPLGKPMCKREENMKMDIQEVGWKAWTGLICLRTGICDGHL